MGRSGAGVEVREKSIRLSFTFNGTPRKHTLCVNGLPIRPTAANVKYAYRVAAEIRGKIDAGTFLLADYFPEAEDAGPTSAVSSILATFEATLMVEHSTLRAYSSAINFWKEQLGEKNGRMLKHSEILAALKTRAHLSGKTVANYVSVLRSAFALAVKDKVLTENPVGEIEAPYQAPEPDPFTMDEMEAILGHVAKTYDESVSNYIEVRFFTGLRPSEQAALRWPSVDMRSGYFVVDETLVESVHKDRTKTSKARKVLMNSRARAGFSRQLARTFMLDREGHVFLNPMTGEPWAKAQYFTHNFWKPTLRKLKIRYREPYQTRHTYATMMLMAGMTPAFCAKQLGHDIKVFLTTYSKWLDGAADALEMARLEGAISPGGSPEKAPDVATG